ncbi:hypothetical protein [Parasitella parasitica]|uniref:RING-type domain-containing protein n=1 Tax=Parasitella parasitica TaxID=35722 RepID=A0A0B7MXG5_9FUNG|nr:hypothetical protein [Parasitella parasitica]
MDIEAPDTCAEIGSILAGMYRELRCSICLSTLNEATTTFCGHTFCKNCIEKQVIDNNCCSACEEQLNTSQLHSAEPLRGIVYQFMQMKEEFERINGVQLSAMEISNLPQQRPIDAQTAIPIDTHADEEDQPLYRILQLTQDPIAHIDIPGAHLEKKISSKITHVVVNAGMPRHYKPKLDAGLKISVEQGYMSPEQRFEIYGDETYGRTGAPSKARLRRESNKSNNLFKKLKVGLIDDVNNEYRKYLTIGRAEIGDFPDLIVCNLNANIEELKKKHSGKVLISCKWIESSICLFELDVKDKYIL